MGTSKRLILENRLGQKVRSFLVDSEQISVIYRLDSGRIEIQSDLEDLNHDEVEYQLLQTLKTASLEKGSLTLTGLGLLRMAQEQESLNGPTHSLNRDTEDQKMPSLLKKTSLVHLGGVACLVLLSIGMGYLAEKKVEPPLVTITIPAEKTPAVRKNVQVSERKVTPVEIKKARVVSHPVEKRKIVPRVVVKSLPSVRKSPVVVRHPPTQNLRRLGALSALGGAQKGARDAEGLNTQSLKNIRSAGQGHGGGGVGAGRGGMTGLLPGSGLIAGSRGAGGQAETAGGYGTRGSSGGKAGYGKISLVGGTSGVTLPLEDEALVEGGLDRDQIAAVINRNKGQIVYCYEQGLQKDPDLRGRVSVQFVIGGSGRITRANVTQSSLDSRLVETCMVAKMKNWQFPRPVGQVNVDVLYPFDLRRVTSR